MKIYLTTSHMVIPYHSYKNNQTTYLLQDGDLGLVSLAASSDILGFSTGDRPPHQQTVYKRFLYLETFQELVDAAVHTHRDQ